MPQPQNSIFNKRATEKLRSPDDLDRYVRVTNPSVYAILGACLALLAGLLAWGIFGSVTTSVTGLGARVEGDVICFLDTENASVVSVGDIANVSGEHMEVAEISAVPLSRSEAGKVLGSDYLTSSLVTGEWAYQVRFTGDASKLAAGVPLSVNITTERIAPLVLVMGGES